MTYLLLAVTLFCNSIQSIITKQYSVKVEKQNPYVYSVIVTVISLMFFLIASGGHLRFNAVALGYSATFGISYALAIIGNVCAVSCGPLSITAMIMQLSLVLPTLYGIVFLRERISVMGYIGIALVFICIFLINPKGKKSTENKIQMKWYLWVGLGFIGNGMCSVIQKMQQLRFSGEYKTEFMIFALTEAALLISAFALMKRTGEKGYILSAIRYAPFQGLANGGTNMLVMILTAMLPAAVLFPVVLAGGIVVSFFASLIFFKEKFTARSLFGYALGMISIILINL